MKRALTERTGPRSSIHSGNERREPSQKDIKDSKDRKDTKNKVEEIYSEYDGFAWFYNRHWGEEFSRPVLEIFNFVLFPNLSAGARILDLCCGTGQLAAGLIAQGYRVTGIDGSQAMLDLARLNAPEALLVRADARTFTLQDTFDAVVSTFDSLNHVLSLEELTEVFRRVHAALDADGIFLFDLNMEEEFETAGRESGFDIVEEDHACVVRSTFEPRAKLKRYEVTMFNLDGEVWRRNDLTLLQRYYDSSDVVAALTEAGFNRISIHNAHREFGLALSDGRAFFLARRP